MESARAQLGRLGKWGSSRLRIGASTTACQHVLPAVLREFKESFPQCAISIEPGDTPEMIEALRQHRIDLAVNLEPRRNEPLEFRPLFTDELVFITSPLHPWAKSGRVTRDEIPRQHYILYGKTSYTFQMIETYFRKEQIVLHSLLDLGNMEAIKELVKLGPWCFHSRALELRQGVATKVRSSRWPWASASSAAAGASSTGRAAAFPSPKRLSSGSASRSRKGSWPEAPRSGATPAMPHVPKVYPYVSFRALYLAFSRREQ